MEKIRNYQELTEAIKKAMANQGITQSGLAKKLGVHQPQVNRALSGKNSPSVDLVFKILEVVKIEVGILVPGA